MGIRLRLGPLRLSSRSIGVRVGPVGAYVSAGRRKRRPVKRRRSAASAGSSDCLAYRALTDLPPMTGSHTTALPRIAPPVQESARVVAVPARPGTREWVRSVRETLAEEIARGTAEREWLGRPGPNALVPPAGVAGWVRDCVGEIHPDQHDSIVATLAARGWSDRAIEDKVLSPLREAALDRAERIRLASTPTALLFAQAPIEAQAGHRSPTRPVGPHDDGSRRKSSKERNPPTQPAPSRGAGLTAAPDPGAKDAAEPSAPISSGLVAEARATASATSAAMRLRAWQRRRLAERK